VLSSPSPLSVYAPYESREELDKRILLHVTCVVNEQGNSPQQTKLPSDSKVNKRTGGKNSEIA
jgi:hypothetical protein